MNILIILALLALAVYWGNLLVPKLRLLVSKVKAKISEYKHSKNTKE